MVRMRSERGAIKLAGGTRRTESDERGAVLVLTAIMALVLLGFAAIAVDMTNARQVRRQAQGSADAAALAGAQDLPDPNAVVATVKDYALQNFDTAVSDWVGCSDPDALVELPDLGNSNTCISLDEPLARVRVRLPVNEAESIFGNVLGYNHLDVSASAVAEADLTRDDRIIPATVAAAAGSGNICIENGGNDTGCAARSSGNFGSFDSRRMNIYFPTSSDQANSLRINYSMGVDHVLSIYGTGDTRVCDVQNTSPCSTTNELSGDDANHLIPFTGNVVPPLTEGVVDNDTISTDQGSILFCGRLRRPDLTDANLTLPDPENCDHWENNPGPGPALTVLGEDVNGRHVSYWLNDEFDGLFYPGTDPTTNSAAPSPSTYWDAGDARLECFVKSYRFDYAGTLGHPAQTEFFINPALPINNVGQGTEFTLAEATDYLKNTCGLDPTVVDAKMASLTDSADWWPMFENDMVVDPRFGMIPVVSEWSTGGSTSMPIVRFWGTFMYRLYTSSTKVKGIDAWVFEPALIETESGIADLQFGYQSGDGVIHLDE